MYRLHAQQKDIDAYGSVSLPSFPRDIITSDELSREACEKFLVPLRASEAHASGVYGADGSNIINSSHRSSSYCTIPDELFKELNALIVPSVTRLVASAGVRGTLTLGEPLQLLRYDAANSGHFSPHTDSAYWDAQGKFQYTSPTRKVSTVTYLNDDYEGGELVLNSLRDATGLPLAIKPTVGLMVLFPSDLRFMHEVRPVTRGQRYSVVGWFDLTPS